MEIEKNTVWGKVFSPKNNLEFFKTKFFAQMTCGFACICEFLQASCSPHFQSGAV